MKVTIRKLVEASEKNGFRWARGDRKNSRNRKGFETDPSCANYSCVVGQGLANLHNNDFDVMYSFPMANSTGNVVLDLAFESIYRYNDEEAESYADAVRYMKEALAPFMDEVIIL